MISPLRTALQYLCLAAWLAPFTLFAQSATSAHPAHPIVGTWRWALFGGKCQETYLFRPDGTLRTTSAEAVTESTYRVTPEATASGFYRLALLATSHNGKSDCSGDRLQEDSPELSAFIQLSPAKDRFISCKTQSLTACFGPLGRVQ